MYYEIIIFIIVQKCLDLFINTLGNTLGIYGKRYSKN